MPSDLARAIATAASAPPLLPFDAIIARLTDTEVLGLTGWAEARGDVDQGHSSLLARVAVMCVARNRLARHEAFRAAAPTYKAVCLAPLQFSCWSLTGGRTNYAALLAVADRLARGVDLGDPLLGETLFLADGVTSGLLRDVTQGATMYYAPDAMSPVGAVPAWAKNRSDWLLIGSQRYFSV